MKVWAKNFIDAMNNVYKINKSNIDITIDTKLDYLRFDAEHCGIKGYSMLELDTRDDLDKDKFIVMKNIRPIRAIKTNNSVFNVWINEKDKVLVIHNDDINLQFDYK